MRHVDNLSASIAAHPRDAEVKRVPALGAVVFCHWLVWRFVEQPSVALSRRVGADLAWQRRAVMHHVSEEVFPCAM